MRQEKPSYYGIIPSHVRYDKDLSSSAKLFYSEVTALSNAKGHCWASNGYFAELYGVSERAVQKWVSQLAKKDYVIVELNRKTNQRSIKVGEQKFVTTRTKVHEGMNKSSQGHEQKFIHNNKDNSKEEYSEQSSPQDHPILFCKRVMNYLSKKTGKKFRLGDDAQIKRSDKFAKVNARIAEGYVFEDFKKVIDVKVLDWLEDPKMAKFLRPATLFCLKNFEKYLDDWESKNSTLGESGMNAPITQQEAKETIRKIFAKHKDKWGGKNSKYGRQAQTDYVAALNLFYKDHPELKNNDPIT